MPIARDLAAQPLEHPAGIALPPEEHRAVIVVDSVNLESLPGEEPRNLDLSPQEPVTNTTGIFSQTWCAVSSF